MFLLLLKFEFVYEFFDVDRVGYGEVFWEWFFVYWFEEVLLLLVFFFRNFFSDNVVLFIGIEVMSYLIVKNEGDGIYC